VAFGTCTCCSHCCLCNLSAKYTCMGYADPPWQFRGRAVYQLNLVHVDTARQYLPEALHGKLVSLFGYTLGGFFLARYDDSPVGAFNELVVISGLLWNPPTSCAWAARVFVDNKHAKEHGVVSVGLPSRHSSFTLHAGDSSSASASASVPHASWWSQGTLDASPHGHVQLNVSDETACFAACDRTGLATTNLL
jgi:hypothetical protein